MTPIGSVEKGKGRGDGRRWSPAGSSGRGEEGKMKTGDGCWSQMGGLGASLGGGGGCSFNLGVG